MVKLKIEITIINKLRRFLRIILGALPVLFLLILAPKLSYAASSTLSYSDSIFSSGSSTINIENNSHIGFGDCPIGCNFDMNVYQNTIDTGVIFNTTDTIENCGADVQCHGSYFTIVPFYNATIDPAYCVNQVCYFATPWGNVYFRYFSDTGQTLFSTYENDPDFVLAPGISFITPANGSTLQDFGNEWIFAGYNMIEPSSREYYAQVNFYNNAAPGVIYINAGVVDIASDTFSISKTYSLGVGDYTANAWIIGTSTPDILASATSTFTIVASTTALTAPDCNFTSSSFLGDPVGNIKQGICAAMLWAFLPDAGQQAALNTHFNQLTGKISTKPPFGYFNSVKSAFDSFTTTSTASSSLLDASGTAVFSNTFEPLDVGLAAILWFLFGWYIIHRLKTIEL